MPQATCKERVQEHLDGRLEDLRTLWAAYCAGEEDTEELGNIHEYGLCFDYVAPGTFTDQREGYFRYQLSWGGPSDEFRFYANPDLSVHRIEYWFLDWFDGAPVTLAGGVEAFVMELWDWFREGGAPQNALEQAAE